MSYCQDQLHCLVLHMRTHFVDPECLLAIAQCSEHGHPQLLFEIRLSYPTSGSGNCRKRRSKPAVCITSVSSLNYLVIDAEDDQKEVVEAGGESVADEAKMIVSIEVVWIVLGEWL